MLTVYGCWKWAHIDGLTTVSNYFVDVLLVAGMKQVL